MVTKVEAMGEVDRVFRIAQIQELTSHLDGLAVRLPSKIEDGKNLLLLWQGYWQVEEWVKSDGDL